MLTVIAMHYSYVVVVIMLNSQLFVIDMTESF